MAEGGAYFEMAPVRMQQNELRMTLYAHQIYEGSKQNQQVVVTRSNPSFGVIVANDWAVLDRLGSNANLIGNVQGIHMLGSMTEGRWCIYFDLVFKNGR